MSCTLCWKPVSQDRDSIADIQLREILDKKLGYPKKLSYGHREYLEALVDAGIEGAQELIDAIDTHDEIEIYLEC